jgi:hypothetical protein
VSTAEIVETVAPAPAMSRLDRLRLRQEEIADRAGYLRAQLVALDEEEQAGRLSGLEQPEVPASWDDTPVGLAAATRRRIEEELASLDKDAAAVRELIGAAQADEHAERLAELLEHGKVLRERERAGWAEISRGFERILAGWDTVAATARELEGLRGIAEDGDVRRQLVGPVAPFPVTLPTLLAWLGLVAVPAPSDPWRSLYPAFAGLVPDLSDRWQERLLLSGVDPLLEPW